MLKEELLVTTLLVRSYAYAGNNSIFGKMKLVARGPKAITQLTYPTHHPKEMSEERSSMLFREIFLSFLS